MRNIQNACLFFLSSVVHCTTIYCTHILCQHYRMPQITRWHILNPSYHASTYTESHTFLPFSNVNIYRIPHIPRQHIPNPSYTTSTYTESLITHANITQIPHISGQHIPYLSYPRPTYPTSPYPTPLKQSGLAPLICLMFVWTARDLPSHSDILLS